MSSDRMTCHCSLQRVARTRQELPLAVTRHSPLVTAFTSLALLLLLAFLFLLAFFFLLSAGFFLGAFLFRLALANDLRLSGVAASAVSAGFSSSAFRVTTCATTRFRR